MIPWIFTFFAVVGGAFVLLLTGPFSRDCDREVERMIRDMKKKDEAQ